MAFSIRKRRTAIAAGAMAVALAFSPVSPVANAQTTEITIGAGVTLNPLDLQGSLQAIIDSAQIAVDAGTEALITLAVGADQITDVTVGEVTDAAGTPQAADAITVVRNADGTFTLSTNADLAAGVYTVPLTFATVAGNVTVDVPVTVGTETAPAVTLTGATNNNVYVLPGETAELTLNNVPEGGTVEVVVPEGWTVTAYDAATGTVGITAPAEAELGTTAEVTINVNDAAGTEVQNFQLTANVDEEPGSSIGDLSATAGGADLSAEGGAIAAGSAALGSSAAADANTGETPGSSLDSLTAGSSIDGNGSSTDTIDQQSSLDGSSIQGSSNLSSTNTEMNTTGGSSDQQCIATAAGFGLPLLALVPLGLATQMDIPGLSGLAAQVDQAIKDLNTNIQQGSSVFSPELASAAEQANSALAGFGLNVGTAVAGVAAITYGIVAVSSILDACTPGVDGSSTEIVPNIPGSSAEGQVEGETAETGSAAGSSDGNFAAFLDGSSTDAAATGETGQDGSSLDAATDGSSTDLAVEGEVTADAAQ